MARHNIDFLLDTKPMADEIHGVSKKVEGTTAAVVAMKTAVIAAEAKSTEHICRNVNRGFFSLMHSQMSQKIAEKKSRTEALLMELNAQKHRLLEIKSVMERDYRRIASRYARIITSINKSLKVRVQDLDRPIFNFCDREVESINNRIELLSATVPVCQVEGVSDSQRILASNIKYDSLKVIESTREFLSNTNEQKIITNRILLNSVASKDAVQAIPVVISVSTLDRNGNESVSIAVPERSSQQNQQMIKNEIYGSVDDMAWKDGEIDKNVALEFNRLLANCSSSKRVKETAGKLFASCKVQNL